MNTASFLDPGPVSVGRPEASGLSFLFPSPEKQAAIGEERGLVVFEQKVYIYSRMQNLKVEFRVTALLLRETKRSPQISPSEFRECVLNYNSVLAEIKIVKERSKNSEYIIIWKNSNLHFHFSYFELNNCIAKEKSFSNIKVTGLVSVFE